MDLPLTTYEALAGMVDYPLLQPNLTNVQVVEGIELAKRYGLRCAMVRPCDVDLAVRTLSGSAVRPGSVVGFPHGSQNTAAKLYEARDLLRRGAKQLDAAVSIPALVSREFQHVQTELNQMSETCRKEGATLTVIIESAYLAEELKIVACRCCARAGVDFVGTSTLEDLKLARKHTPEEIGVKAVGIDTLEQALEALAAGAARVETGSAAAILDAWKARLSAEASPPPVVF